PVARRGRELRQGEQRGEGKAATGPGARERKRDQVGVEGHRIASAGAGSPPAVEALRAAAVVDVLPPEAPQREVMGMAHDRARRIDEATARPDPAVAELTVLTRGDGKARVEPPARAEERRRGGEIVGGEEALVALAAGLPLVEIVDQELGGGGVRVV